MNDKPPLKNIYKKSLAIELIKLGHDLHHTMCNRDNPKFQVYVFRHDEKLIRDLVEATKKTKRKAHKQ
ncbi:TPA: hypothetical protein QCX12_005155 [Bacillus paranthracis]|nr:hypothetical protein [Bacillus paranthracis]HDR7523508.1 hypothetical protein [Bacillus paranthracis]